MLRVGSLASLALMLVAACGGDDGFSGTYPPFPNPTEAPDGGGGGGGGPDAMPSGPADPVINEVSVADDGTPDTQDFVEVFGSPNTDYSAYTIIGIEGDSPNQGVIEYIVTVGTTDANGFFTTTLPSQDIEQSAQTFLLVVGFTGMADDDIDTVGGSGDAGDGTIDTTPWASVADSVALDDGAGVYYAGTEGPVLLRGSNGGVARITDGVDTDAEADWAFFPDDGVGVASGDANRTPGATNTVVP